MARSAKKKTVEQTQPRDVGFASRHQDLAGGMPVALRMAPPSRQQFAQVRDPLIAKQTEDLAKTEAERREEGGEGTAKKKVLQRPFPAADHKDVRTAPPARQHFDKARDPLIARQVADLDKTEAQRREAAGEEATKRKVLQRPFPNLGNQHTGHAPKDGETMSQEEVKRQRDRRLADLDEERWERYQEWQEAPLRRGPAWDIDMS
ncbi:MAG: hypothetical protein Kilf2KO_37690 [Rhodospirillales bacterium]